MRFDICDDLKAFLVDAGFVTVVERRFPVPIGSWARGYKYKEAGCWNHARLADGLKDFSLRVMTNAGLSYHDTMARLRKVRTAITPLLFLLQHVCIVPNKQLVLLPHHFQQGASSAITLLHPSTKLLFLLSQHS
jgi:hypothetical protein